MLIAASIVALGYPEKRSRLARSANSALLRSHLAQTLSESLLVKILLVTANFAAPGINPWLLDDLVAALVAEGHEVDVVVHSPTAPRPAGLAPSAPHGTRIFSVGTETVPTGAVAKLRSYVSTGIRLHTAGWKFVKTTQYDLCIYPSIASFSYGFPGRVRRAKLTKRLLFVMWDFFPVHQLEIGRIRLPGVHAPLRRIERAAIADADVIAVMSPANEAFMRNYHPKLKGRYTVIPPWASAPGTVETVKNERFTVLFGGQLAKGRGVDTLLLAAEALQGEGRDIDIVIAGSGPDEADLKEMAARRM
jgi:glycosyltransferase involved in cell wall biosynthesis